MTVVTAYPLLHFVSEVNIFLATLTQIESFILLCLSRRMAASFSTSLAVHFGGGLMIKLPTPQEARGLVVQAAEFEYQLASHI